MRLSPTEVRIVSIFAIGFGAEFAERASVRVCEPGGVDYDNSIFGPTTLSFTNSDGPSGK